MADSGGDWQAESQEDSFDLTGLDVSSLDPLAILGADLALCLQATADHIGGLCDWCTCQLGYHVTCSDGACEICGCVEEHHIPQLPIVNSAPYGNSRKDSLSSIQGVSETTLLKRERDIDAREALRELTE